MIDQPNKKYYSLLFSLPAQTQFSTITEEQQSNTWLHHSALRALLFPHIYLAGLVGSAALLTLDQGYVGTNWPAESEMLTVISVFLVLAVLAVSESPGAQNKTILNVDWIPLSFCRLALRTSSASLVKLIDWQTPNVLVAVIFLVMN